jgi:tetratricopeptide (TPR) repeat protein/tRNA A-37 threonylcarbamoyl transferase component Bud32
MGVVYEAEQISLGRRVAVKVLPFAAALDARHLQRFQNEAHAAAHLHHQHIVPVYGVGCERGVHYYAMQYVDGRTLAELIAELRGEGSAAEAAPQATTKVAQPTGRSTADPARFRTAATLGVQAAEALEHAHQLGVVHRDIKPGNLLVDRLGNLWITDFGLAQVRSDTRLTMTGDLVGTLRYMSPEQALGKRVPLDHRTDIYSLGATLYELLTREPAFDGQDREQLLAQIALEEPRRMRQIDRQIPAELETIVGKAMAKSPEDRYATAQELADDLRRFLEDRPIRARRPTLRQRARKWMHRHPGIVTTAVTALAVAVVILAVSTALILGEYQRAETEKENALHAAAAETKAKETAEAKEAEAEAVLNFVQKHIFAAARPENMDGGLGRTVTMRQAMEAALPMIDKNFADQPLIEARLRSAVANSFYLLGEPKIAIEQYRRARDLYTQHLGAEHRLTLMTATALGTCYTGDGRYADAVKLLTDNLARQKAALGPDDPDTLRTMNNLGIAHYHRGEYDAALRLHDEALARRSAKFGPNDDSTLESMHNLATVYDSLGRRAEALALRETILAQRRARGSARPGATLGAIMNLATSCANVGRHQDALKLREEALAFAKELHGPTHSETISCMGNLAHSYEAVGRFADALKLREEILPLRIKRSGADHYFTFRSMANLASSYRTVGRYAEALKLHDEVLALRKVKLPAGHPDIRAGMYAVANCYTDAHRYADALKLYAETLALLKAKLGPDHPNTIAVMLSMAHVRLKMNEPAAAEALLTEALALAAKHQATLPLETADIRDVLGDCLLRQKQFGKAEELLRASLATRREKDADGWETFWSQSLLGAALLGQQQYADAEPLLLAGSEGLHQRVDRLAAPHRHVLASAIDRLIELYHAWGKEDQADVWRQKKQPRKAQGEIDKKQ